MRPEDLLARLEAGHEYDPMYGQLCNERDQLKAENAKLRKVARELRANLCNRETLLELLGMPSTAETKAAMEDLFNRCDELGVD